MFNTRNELLNLISIVSMSLVFLDPDGVIGQGDMLDHNNLYMGFDIAEDAVIPGGFAGNIMNYYDDDEEE